MQAVPSGRDQPPGGYIRGGGGVGVDGRRVLRILAAVALVAMIGLSLALAVGTTRNDSRLEALSRDGVAVQATVTGCLAISSGVGMGVEYWRCQASYSLGGRTFDETIGDSRHLLHVGRVLPAVAVPGRPDLLALQRPTARSGPGGFLPSMLAGVVAVMMAAVLVWDRRRGRRCPRPTA